ncbi:hypothetical protein BJY01DRAFT_166869 [Aspergillus pseudoustus]|uniref:DUF3074 domain-containing protein n=1 Tax=Aspergillus pseudoustus TaxID=1810923 RepID=A0ABR4K4I7_9EURO
MATLHEALKSLTGTPWDSIPTEQSDLRTYLTDLSTNARLIIDSVPEPSSESNNATAYGKLKPSSTRLETTDEATLAHQREWSKPIKVGSSKDNPLGIEVYKLPGADGNGHWFGRRSVHEGLPFSVWEEKLSGEMKETLRNNQRRMEQGFPADQAVRGIGAEKQIEELEVMDESGEKVLGRVNVYHVSAQFPRPTTARDFVTIIITWERTWSVASEGEGKGRAGRSWMMVSRPCVHPDVPEVQDYIRGEYESVEMIREILVDRHQREGSSSTSGTGSGSSSGEGSNGNDKERAEDESNPVEWIMVTRSDPGGTIPRWMVEKGTPKSICSDAAKFLDWASQPDLGTRQRERASTTKSQASQPVPAEAEDSESSDSDLSEYDQEEHHGLIASVGQLLHAGLERYAPQAFLDYIPQHSRQTSAHSTRAGGTHQPREVPEESPESRGLKTPEGIQDDAMSQASLNSELNTEPNTPGDIHLDLSAAELLQRTKKGKLSSHERQLAKLAQQKRSVEAQIELVRSDIQSLGLRPPEDDVRKEKAAVLGSTDDRSRGASPTSSTQKLGSEDHASSSSNVRSRADTPSTEHPEMNKVATALFREESKLVRRLAKIERHQLKEAAKLEAHQRKEAEKHDKAHSRNETEALRRELESVKKECEKLKSERKQWLGLIGSLQAENTKLTRQIGVVTGTEVEKK